MFTTPEDFDALEHAMVAKTRAEAKLIAAQASRNELAGWGLVLTGAGLGILLACLGVVKFNGENSKTQEAERAFIERVAATPLKVEVTAKIADGGQVTLANTTLHLDPIPPVHVDLNATMRAVASAPDLRAAIFDPPPQAPDSTSPLDQNRIQPAAGLAGEASAKAAQGAPRPPVFEPRPQLRAISAALPASPRRSAQTPAFAEAPAGRPDMPRPAQLTRQASAPAPKACHIAQP